jgi:hypothetical protein
MGGLDTLYVGGSHLLSIQAAQGQGGMVTV